MVRFRRVITFFSFFIKPLLFKACSSVVVLLHRIFFLFFEVILYLVENYVRQFRYFRSLTVFFLALYWIYPPVRGTLAVIQTHQLYFKDKHQECYIKMFTIPNLLSWPTCQFIITTW